MEIRLRCGECDRDVLVDEAFAGGMCRCPHCKATLAVPDRPPGRSGNRPAQPARAERPIRAAEAKRKPVRSSKHMNRIVLLLMLGISAVFFATVAFFMHQHFTEPPATGPKKPANPLDPTDAGTPTGPSIADVSLSGKVAYVLDGGASMRDTYDYAVALTIRSVETLEDDQQYTVIVAGEQSPRAMEGGYHDPGQEAEEFLMNTLPGGATDIAAALSAAGETQPDTVVLLARKPVDDPVAAARLLREAGVRLVTIAIDADESAAASLAEAAAETGGESRNYTRGQIDRWLSGRL